MPGARAAAPLDAPEPVALTAARSPIAGSASQPILPRSSL
jgi:hypothetical protein